MTPPLESPGREPQARTAGEAHALAEAPMASPRAELEVGAAGAPGQGSPGVAGREQAFWDRVQRNPEGCWPWIAGRSSTGYGQFRVDGRSISAHRLAWQFTNGRIPSGLCVCHRCDNPPCCNPEHLFLGTHAANAADKVAKGRARVRFGEEHHNARLTEATVIRIRAGAASGVGVRTMAKRLGVCRNIVRRVVRGEAWRHVDSPDDFAQTPSTDWRAW